MKNVTFIAHRGESFYAPENTVAAVKLAWKNNADGIEIDVRLSRDNKIVVIHDRSTRRISGINLSVKANSLEDLKKLTAGNSKGKLYAHERIPTLGEVLAAVPRGKFVMVEIKCGIEIIPRLRKVIGKSHLDKSQVILAGFGLKKMTIVKRAFPDFETCRINRIGRENIILKSFRLERMIDSSKKNNLDGLSLSYSRWLNKKNIGKIKEAGIKLYVWTVDNPKRALNLINSGVDGIITNRSGWLRERVLEKNVLRKK